MNNSFKIRNRFFLRTLIAYCVVAFMIFHAINLNYSSYRPKEFVPRPTVQIWSKAAIGHYLWQHIFNSPLAVSKDKFFIRGSHTESGILFQFYGGPGYIQTTLPSNVTHLVLVLNGRTPKTVQASLLWLEFLPRLNHLKNVAVVILGNERCENLWILEHLKRYGGMIDVLFLVYDSTLVNHRDVFQWPLGVSTYRNFPTRQNQGTSSSNERKYACNFFGTVYKDSSREELMKILLSGSFKRNCVVSSRYKWAPKETTESLTNYTNALNDSDFTLCPVGFNTECYRVYEAMAFGSIPVVEDVQTEGECDRPLRLLKRYDPPFVFIKNWTELDSVLQSYDLASIQKLRIRVVNWYSQFKVSMKNTFISIIKQKFKFDENEHENI